VFLAQDRSVSIANKDWCMANMATINAWFGSHQAEIEACEQDDELLEDEG